MTESTTSFPTTRRSTKADIVTGTMGASNSREQAAFLRPPSLRRPMSRHKRAALESHSSVMRAVWGVYNSVVGRCRGRRISGESHSPTAAASNTGRLSSHHRRHSDLSINSVDEKEYHDDQPQYTLKSVRRRSPSAFRRFTRCICRCTRSNINSQHEFIDIENEEATDINAAISAYLSFSHRTSYFLLFLVFSLLYYANILVFAVIFYLYSLYQPECITSAGNTIGVGDMANIFTDSFVLSWTTFSTVGYGNIYPSTGANSDDLLPQNCVFVGVVGSFEAFVGVLYAGFCTAVLFGKVIRSQSQAQVYFSEPLVVRYGKEELLSGDFVRSTRAIVESNSENDVEDVEIGNTLTSIEENRSIKNDLKDVPCPSLEFRLVNRLHDDESAIVEAKLDCVAILDEDRGSSTSDSTDGNGEAPVQHWSEYLAKATFDAMQQFNRTASTANTDQILSPRSKKPRIITKLSLDANEHPFFRRVWFGRHVLDENSPLLSESAKEKIKLNGGYWPPEWNNHLSIREHLYFRHILVCFSGTSNASVRDVYAHKVYDLVDVNVGYRFVPMNYHSADGALKTDSYLLNAICEQRGGEAEPVL